MAGTARSEAPTTSDAASMILFIESLLYNQ
jgi:hypothetical protein